MVILSPSLLSANLGMLHDEVALLASAGVPWVHWDIMDGVYVPNITMGASCIRAVHEKVHTIFFDVHLMIVEPERHVDAFIQAGANLLVIHPCATRHPQRLLAYIRSCGVQSGIAINPHEAPQTIEYLLPYTDVILVMGVNPGFSGQQFIPETIQKIARLHTMIVENKYDVQIEVDGGVSIMNIAALHAAGAEIFVSGSSFFQGLQKTKEAYAERYKQFVTPSQWNTL